MTTKNKVACRKLSLLILAHEMGSVRTACKIMDYSRQQFYEIRRNFQSYGADGLIDRLPDARGPHPNRVSAEVEKAVLVFCLASPTKGCLAVVQHLNLEGVTVSAGGVRGGWNRHNLTTKHDRLLRLEEHVKERRVKLTDEQVRLLERFSPEFRERHIETRCTGDLVTVDTFFVGTLKGVGRICLQTVIDTFSRFVWGILHTSKIPLTAVQTLNNHVLSFFDEHKARIDTVLSDNGREFCGRPDKHPYELFLQLEEIEHRTTKVRRPQNNDFVERLHRTLLDEHFRIKGREKFYESADEMQDDQEAYLVTYNTKRPHQGRGVNGTTPLQAFKKGLKLRPKTTDPKTKEVPKKKAA